MWIQKRSVNDSTAPKAQHDPQWPWSEMTHKYIQCCQQTYPTGKHSSGFNHTQLLLCIFTCTTRKPIDQVQIALKRCTWTVSNENRILSPPKISPIVEHWLQCVRASNCLGSSSFLCLWVTFSIEGSNLLAGVMIAPHIFFRCSIWISFKNHH